MISGLVTKHNWQFKSMTDSSWLYIERWHSWSVQLKYNFKRTQIPCQRKAKEQDYSVYALKQRYSIWGRSIQIRYVSCTDTHLIQPDMYRIHIKVPRIFFFWFFLFSIYIWDKARSLGQSRICHQRSFVLKFQKSNR